MWNIINWICDDHLLMTAFCYEIGVSEVNCLSLQLIGQWQNRSRYHQGEGPTGRAAGGIPRSGARRAAGGKPFLFRLTFAI